MSACVFKIKVFFHLLTVQTVEHTFAISYKSPFFLFLVKAIRKFAGLGFLTANWSSHPSMTHVSFAWPAFLMTASLAWNSGTPQAYLRTILPNLLDAHVFGYCGWNLDGTRSDGCVASPGKATIN